MKIKTLIALGSVAVATAPLAGCGTGEAGVSEIADAGPLLPLPVEVAQPERTDLFEVYETTATIGSDAEAVVLARVPGEVIEIFIEEGAQVEEGQVLARLDGERLRLQMVQAKASLDMAARELERLQSLRERGLVSASAVENLGFDVESLTASYELMRLNYGYTEIRAPISGVVSSREVKIGTHVETAAPVFRITGTTELVAYLQIPQVELARIETGDQVQMGVDALPGEVFRATIARISPTIDTSNGTFRATLYIDNVDGQLAPGMFSRFSIACEEHPDALVVPSRAIVQEDNEHVVYVVNDGAASRRSVTVGISSGGVTEVLGGLDGSDTIVVTGQASLRDGSKVLASNAVSDSVTG